MVMMVMGWELGWSAGHDEIIEGMGMGMEMEVEMAKLSKKKWRVMKQLYSDGHNTGVSIGSIVGKGQRRHCWQRGTGAWAGQGQQRNEV